MKITTIGIDLAKNVFQIHGSMHGERRCCASSEARAGAVFFANLPPCVIGMEACASAHHWARKLQRLGTRCG